MKKILLDEQSFKILVNGGTIAKEDIEIILQDIGFERMKELIDEVETFNDGLMTNELFKAITNPIDHLPKVGDKVFYIPFLGCNNSQFENGIVKGYGYTDEKNYLFVVFDCNNDWKNYKNYTGQGVNIKQLRNGWVNTETKENYTLYSLINKD